MKLVLFCILAVIGIIQGANAAASECNSTVCQLENGCRCSSKTSPLALEDTPQLIVLAFADAAKEDIYNTYWSPLVEPRTNPDGAFVGATFYVSHEFSNYQIVHDLAANGFEIGVHSVTNNPDQYYWRDANESLLIQEFGSARTIVSKFANIPIEKIIGTLTPQLQLAGDNSIKAFVNQSFSYDNSWTSKSHFFPYTLDYASTQSCDTGSKCPSESHPGFWISPINDLISDRGDLCATIASCFHLANNQTADEIRDWLVGQVQSVKNDNRVPLTFIIEENLFKNVNNSWDGLNAALDELQKDPEVFLVSQARVIDWMKNPVAVKNFTTNNPSIVTGCSKQTCSLKTAKNEDRYMVSCVPCPNNYPWLDNPEGN